jgi:hypothetical protein
MTPLTDFWTTDLPFLLRGFPDNYEHPWVARVAEMKSSAAMNVDAEMKVLKLNEEIRELVKDTRAKVRPHRKDFRISKRVCSLKANNVCLFPLF